MFSSVCNLLLFLCLSVKWANSVNQNLLREANWSSVKKFLIFVFTRARHFSPSYVRLIQSAHFRTISVRSSSLPLPFPLLNRGLFRLYFPTRNLYEFLFSPVHATCPVNLIHFSVNAVIVFGEMYKSPSSSLRSFPQATVRVFLCTLLSNTPSLVLILLWETRCHAHIELQTLLSSQRIQTNLLHNTTFICSEISSLFLTDLKAISGESYAMLAGITRMKCAP